MMDEVEIIAFSALYSAAMADIIHSAITVVHFGIYLGLCIVIIARYQQGILQEFSYIERIN